MYEVRPLVVVPRCSKGALPRTLAQKVLWHASPLQRARKGKQSILLNHCDL
jgi:hypothetical protein